MFEDPYHLCFFGGKNLRKSGGKFSHAQWWSGHKFNLPIRFVQIHLWNQPLIREIQKKIFVRTIGTMFIHSLPVASWKKKKGDQWLVSFHFPHADIVSCVVTLYPVTNQSIWAFGNSTIFSNECFILFTSDTFILIHSDTFASFWANESEWIRIIRMCQNESEWNRHI